MGFDCDRQRFNTKDRTGSKAQRIGGWANHNTSSLILHAYCLKL